MTGRRSAFALIGSAAVVVAASAAQVASAGELNADQLVQLRAGEALVSVTPDDSGEADGHIEAVIDIPSPPHRVWLTMLDCERSLKFVEHLKSCKVLQRGPNGSWDIREHHSKWLSILPEMVSVFRSDYVTDKEIRFERVSGGLRFLKGTWRFEALNGGMRTRVFYSVRIGISAPIPGFMIRSQIEQDVPKLLKALRAETLSGR